MQNFEKLSPKNNFQITDFTPPRVLKLKSSVNYSNQHTALFKLQYLNFELLPRTFYARFLDNTFQKMLQFGFYVITKK